MWENPYMNSLFFFTLSSLYDLTVVKKKFNNNVHLAYLFFSTIFDKSHTYAERVSKSHETLPWHNPKWKFLPEA